MVLPAPERSAEDAYVASWHEREDDDFDELVEVISAAMEARRPQLAARLVGLLDGRVEVLPGSPLERAQRAARLLLVAAPDAVAALAEDLDAAWLAARRGRMRRLKERMRDRHHSDGGLLDRASPRRKPRLTGKHRRG